MIEMKNVGFRYSEKEVLAHVDFLLRDGEFVGILGPNGGGKSTFLRLTLGLLRPQEGTIVRKERKISYIAQTTPLSDASFPSTVEEMVSLGLVGPRIHFQNKQDKEKIVQTLRDWDLLDLRKRLVSELSGGQLQRVKIAKAIIGNPSLLVLDEPDAGMDEESHKVLLDMVQKQKERGTSLLFVSHHPHDLEHADRIDFIESGRLVSYEEEKQRGHHHVDL